MVLNDVDISQIRNKIVRGEMLKKLKKEKAQAKLKKRIARKEAEQRGEVVERGWTRTIENTREWLGDSEEYNDPRTRPAKVEVDEATGDVKVDLGTLSTLFPAQPTHDPSLPIPQEPKLLITTSPGKPPSLYTKDFCEDLMALLGGKTRADIVPRRSPKFELGKVARWAKGRGYGAIAVVGEDHSKPTTLTLSLLPHGPTAHFRLTGVTLGKDIKGHAKPTSHPPELVLNHFSTPLGLSLASLLSHLFLPPSRAETLQSQGYVGRQVVLAQNSRDFVFIRRYRYMFALKSHQLGSKKKVGLERINKPDEEAEDEVIKARFQEMGPRMTLKMRWIRRGALGETGDERVAREKAEKEEGLEKEPFGEGQGVPDDDGGELGGRGGDEEEMDDEEEEREAAKAIGIDVTSNEAAQPNFGAGPSSSTADPVASTSTSASAEPVSPSSGPTKKERKTPRKRSKPYHALLRPPPSPSPPPGQMLEAEPVPLPSGDGKKKEKSLLSTVGKTWHAGKGEGGVREGAKRREWGWEAKMQVSRRKFFL